MTDEEMEALLEELETALHADVTAALALTAQDFTDALEGATELVAARFSVSGIRNMWRRRVGGIMTRLRSIAGRAAEQAADDAGTELPDSWAEGLADYEAATEVLLQSVGDRLAAEASETLAEGMNAGETLDQLKDRLAAVFATDGTQLGEGRATRIAQTEATRAFNAGTLAAAQAMTGPDKPLVKQWLTRNDERVRPSHVEANGQLQLLDDAFDVGGVAMQYPGDPLAPAGETINCRCLLRTSAAAQEGNSNVDQDGDLSAAADVHTGAMIALMPTEADAARLALEGWEDADQLHLTLYYLGDAADWTAEQQGSLISRVSYAARLLTPLGARAFGSAQWNPASDEPAWVWNVGNDNDVPGSTLEDAKYEVTYALEDGHDDPELPQQYTPWSPHICAGYGSDDLMGELASRVGPVMFDRIRVAFAGQYTDIPLTGTGEPEPEPVEPEVAVMDEVNMTPTWSTPGRTALAFENQKSGDGRVIGPGALTWSAPGPWPLQYADEMQGGHDGAQLAGAIHEISRDGDRIPGAGVLYLMQQAGYEAAMLLAQGAPLGVSVDLDDVDIEMVDNTPGAAEAYALKLITASLLPLPDGGWRLTGETEGVWTASGDGNVNNVSTRLDVVVNEDGTVPRALFDLAAAAGEPDSPDGVVVDSQRSGDYLLRITKGRIRGATLVSIPAYADARIVLDSPDLFASYSEEEVTAAIKSTTDYDKVLRHVRASKVPVGAARLAQALKMPVVAAQRILAVAASRGEVVRLTRGLYTDKTTSAKADHLMNDNLVASDLPEDMRFHVIDEELSEEIEAGDNAMAASAWAAMKDLPPMPAAWFAEPTAEELPPGGPGVNYSNGRIFGWVAQADEPHAGFAKKITINTLGRIDTTHFLRQRFTLDDGSSVKAGSFTMNAGHHRDGAECETASCQFDDTRTVAGIVTVGMSDGGMWFSGAAAPWLSEWDRSVFMSTQPSYHLKKGSGGAWQLRAVLAVPVPGHSSPLLASAVVERAQLALTASATMVEVEEAVAAEVAVQAAAELVEGTLLTAETVIDYDRLADAIVAAGIRQEERKAAEESRLAELRAEAAKIDLDTIGTEGI